MMRVKHTAVLSKEHNVFSYVRRSLITYYITAEKEEKGNLLGERRCTHFKKFHINKKVEDRKILYLSLIILILKKHHNRF